MEIFNIVFDGYFIKTQQETKPTTHKPATKSSKILASVKGGKTEIKRGHHGKGRDSGEHHRSNFFLFIF